MTDFETRVTVMTGADGAFDILSDPVRLPQVVSVLRLVDSIAVEGELDLDADFKERDGAPEAGFTADRPTGRIAWGRPGETYGGSFQIEAGTSRTSSVTIRLHVRDDADLEAVQRIFDETALAVRRVLSAR